MSARPTKTYPFDDSYDFAFRPATYWLDLPSEEAITSKIPGTARRDVARRALEGEELPRIGSEELYREAMDFALSEHLSDEERESWGSIHPALMGGEYLPEPEGDEVEIARIELASVTADVIQVLAGRAESGQIRYRVVDEYWDEGSRYAVTPEVSEEPLSMGELVDLIDSARQADEAHLYGDDRFNVGLADSARELNYFSGAGLEPEELLGFVFVSSAFYPELSRYYAERASAWIDQRASEPRPPRYDFTPPTEEEIAAQAVEKEAALDEKIKASGKSYTKTKFVFDTVDERTRFIGENFPDFYDLPHDDAMEGLTLLRDGGGLLLIHYLNVWVCTPDTPTTG